MITSLFFLAILLVGVPIGICLCLAGVVFILNSGSTVLFQSFPLQMFAGVDSYGLIAIPLFILIGEIMNSGGITRRLVELAMAFIGSVKGGLAYVNILANMMVASIIGSATAQVAIMSQVMVRIDPTPVYRDFYQMLGAAPTPIPTPAVFDAMSNGQVDGLEADIEFSWNQRFDKVAKSLLQMNALFMPFAPLVSGRIWQGLDAKDKDLIRRLVAQSLDAQITDIVTTEAGLIEKFKATPIAFHTAADFKPDGLIAEFDKLWLPKAPQIAELRKVGASL